MRSGFLHAGLLIGGRALPSQQLIERKKNKEAPLDARARRIEEYVPEALVACHRHIYVFRVCRTQAILLRIEGACRR